jgi:hypothetical protein
MRWRWKTSANFATPQSAQPAADVVPAGSSLCARQRLIGECDAARLLLARVRVTIQLQSGSHASSQPGKKPLANCWMQMYSTSAATGKPQRLTQLASAATPVSLVGQADTHASQGAQVAYCAQASAGTLQLRSAH